MVHRSSRSSPTIVASTTRGLGCRCAADRSAGWSPHTWGIRPAVPQWRTRSGAHPAGHTGRTHACRRRRGTGILYAGRSRDTRCRWRAALHHDESGSVLLSSPPKEVRSFDVNGALQDGQWHGWGGGSCPRSQARHDADGARRQGRLIQDRQRVFAALCRARCCAAHHRRSSRDRRARSRRRGRVAT